MASPDGLDQQSVGALSFAANIQADTFGKDDKQQSQTVECL
jgi:hypothetical protein